MTRVETSKKTISNERTRLQLFIDKDTENYEREGKDETKMITFVSCYNSGSESTSSYNTFLLLFIPT